MSPRHVATQAFAEYLESRRHRHPEPVGADAPDRADLGESTARKIARPTSEEIPMAKNQTPKIDLDDDVDDVPDRADMGALADTLVDRGRAVLDQFPAVADSARGVLAGAQDQVNGLSDMGIVAASGFALGVSSGLLLAGAPRAILTLSMIPVALTLRSAFARGMRPARLLN